MVRQRNRSTVLEMIRRHGTMSRAELAAETELSSATVSNVVRDLIAARLVASTGEVAPKAPASVGPRTWLLGLNTAYHRVLSVHQTALSIRLGLHDVGGNVLESALVRPNPGEDPARTIRKVTSGLRRLVRHHQVAEEQVRAVGVGAVGLVEPDTGVVLTAPGIGWMNVPLREWLTTELGWPVTVVRNLHAMAAGELRFADIGPAPALYVAIRTGIGSVVLSNQTVMVGANGQAAHLGHVLVPGGGPCTTCGNTGCLETVASIPALANQARRDLPHLPDTNDEQLLETVVEQTLAGDAKAAAVVEIAANHVGYALAQTTKVLDPSTIIINSVLTRANNAFMTPLAQAIHKDTHTLLNHNVDIRPANLQDTAGLVGAAMVALDAHVYDQSAPILQTHL